MSDKHENSNSSRASATLLPNDLKQTLMSQRIWLVLPAAGTGQRMQSDKPKQYLTINKKTIIDLTLSRFLNLDFIFRIVVVVGANDANWSTLSISKDPKIDTVLGGNTRQQSVSHALAHIQSVSSESERLSDWVLVHDAARPCVSLDKITELIRVSMVNPAGSESVVSKSVGSILATPITHSVKESTNDSLIKRSVPREHLWLANTPQFFPLTMLATSIQHALDSGFELTDEASAIEASGYTVRIVPDRRDNIKITLPEDLFWAEAILKHQSTTTFQG